MSSVDPRIWKAIAGSRKVPDVGSLVYYFPQGHAEQSSSPPNFSSLSITKPYSLCRVADVHLLSDPDTDEVFAKIHLNPLPFFTSVLDLVPKRNLDDNGVEIGIGRESDAISFAKILTPMDGNGLCFTMSRFCAESILPELDINAYQPAQIISVSDVQGNCWRFRHIFRGTPPRHMLTAGWSRFLNSKKLISGDTIVFIKNSDGDLFVGIQRTGRLCGNANYVELDKNSNVGSKHGLSRNLKGGVPAESIVEAVRLMELSCEFDVLYYPRVGSVGFLVEKEVVDRALRSYWAEGMRVKMSVETKGSTEWFQGTVRRKDTKDLGLWANSPWRMLQVTWDEPGVLQNVTAVSPWQVEFVPTSPQMQAPFPAMKNLNVPPILELSSEGHGNVLFPPSVTNSVKTGSSTSLFNHHTIPAGMQGARHDFCIPSLSAVIHWNTQNIFFNNLYGINMPEELNSSESESASPPSQESIHNHCLELLGVASCNATRKVSRGSFQLFGQVIHMDQPNDDDSVDGEYAENDTVQLLELSLACPYNRLLDGGVVQRELISAVEACSL